MSDEQPSTSSSKDSITEKSSEKPGDEQMIDPFIDFECHICKMKEKCLFGELKVADGSYDSPVYFMRDPFKPPSRDRIKKPFLDEFLILGAPCSVCSQPVCMSDGCSLFFGANFCAPCVSRERRRFPSQLIRGIITKSEAKQHNTV
uniref:Cysteine-rich DPF motif domain-containing protein 1 n=1 Tax=Caenorhabditis tropicalis TaxID=1561998 RepID=A0A1I7UFT1_9PELO